ncbi:predicted protein [Sparassis crispa]|uniref:FAD-binding domain-containing protein n=1 Tax=Sparassis crispa TaxID=139825 RepID=A0A401GVJ0_9APHY|nr:predicted protein [Sparassis crispa]GBE86251.1 predicted protein [Sparassis crispa]
MPPPSEIPTLIVGAGPAGLALALTLIKNGVKVRIIDKALDYHIGTRGSGLQARTLEVLHFLGVLPDIQAKAIPMKPRRLYKLPRGVEPIDTRYMLPPMDPTPSVPFVNALMLGQESSESILRTHIEKLGSHIELSTELRSLEQTADHVVAHLVKICGDEEISETVTCLWLVGVDGAKGVVRKQLGLSFLGETRVEESIIVGDIELRGLDTDYWHTWGDRFTTFVMLRPTETDGLFNFVLSGQMDYSLVISDHAELIRALRAGTDRNDLVFGRVRWISNYTPNIRMVEKFADGRVFLAGDAAHVHSPSGGQGLNSSVQDVFNLGWKLALAIKGVAAPSLMSTYSEERVPVIREMLTQTTKILDKVNAARADDRSSQQVAWTRGRQIMMLGVNYRWSSVVVDERVQDTPEEQALSAYGGEGGKEVRAGDRAPDAPELVVLGGSEAAAKSTPTSLFEIFSPAYHTVLLFSDDASSEQLCFVTQELALLPKDLVRLVTVYPQGARRPEDVGAASAHFNLVDGSGHAYGSYSIPEKGLFVVIVRPDGVVGAMVSNAEGVRQYLQGVFSLSA